MERKNLAKNKRTKAKNAARRKAKAFKKANPQVQVESQVENAKVEVVEKTEEKQPAVEEKKEEEFIDTKKVFFGNYVTINSIRTKKLRNLKKLKCLQNHFLPFTNLMA